MKQYIITAAIFAAFIFGAYWAGGRIADARCHAEIAETATADATDAHNQIIKQMGIINEKTLTAGTDAIRRVLRDKYTIAE